MAGKSNTVGVVTELAEPIVQEFGLVLWDVIFEKEGASWFLRVFIDKDEVVMVSDCEHVSRKLSDRLDEVDPIDQNYYLEVASAGLGRKLKRPFHFEVFLGESVTVKLIRPVDKIREFVGTLKSFQDNIVTIETDNGDRSFDLSDCSYVKVNDDLDLF